MSVSEWASNTSDCFHFSPSLSTSVPPAPVRRSSSSSSVIKSVIRGNETSNHTVLTQSKSFSLVSSLSPTSDVEEGEEAKAKLSINPDSSAKNQKLLFFQQQRPPSNSLFSFSIEDSTPFQPVQLNHRVTRTLASLNNLFPASSSISSSILPYSDHNNTDPEDLPSHKRCKIASFAISIPSHSSTQHSLTCAPNRVSFSVTLPPSSSPTNIPNNLTSFDSNLLETEVEVPETEEPEIEFENLQDWFYSSFLPSQKNPPTILTEMPSPPIPTTGDNRHSSYTKSLLDAIRNTDHPTLMQLIVDEGHSPLACNAYGESIVHLVARLQDSVGLDFLVSRFLYTAANEHGDPTRIDDRTKATRLVDDMGRSPLHDALWCLKRLGSAQKTDKPYYPEGTGPLDFRTVELLLRADPSCVYIKDNRGNTALEYVASANEGEVKVLLEGFYKMLEEEDELSAEESDELDESGDGDEGEEEEEGEEETTQATSEGA